MDKLRNRLLKSGLSKPFDIFEICSKIDKIAVDTCNFTTPGLRGMVTLAKDKDDINCILINSNLSYAEQNFHGLHELIHVCDRKWHKGHKGHKGQTFNCFDKVKPYQDSYLEWVANEGAAELSLSYKDVLPFVKEILPTLEKEMFPISVITRMLSEKYKVSQAVVQHRLTNLKYELCQYLNGIPLDEIQIVSLTHQERNGIHIDSLEQIENKRLIERISSQFRKHDLSTPFLLYSESYRDFSASNIERK